MEVELINTATLEWPVTVTQFQAAHPDVGLPTEENILAQIDWSTHGYALLHESAKPVFDPLTQQIVEAVPVLIDGRYTRTWNVVALSAEQIALNQAVKAGQDAKTIADKIEQLWAAADAYVTGYISGAAIGILTIGVIQQKPKCLAVSDWSRGIWIEYYERKAGITLESELNLDFSEFGPMPHTVPELQAEVLG